MREKYLFRSRTIAAVAFTLVLIAILLSRMVWLQVINYDHYTTLSTNNRVAVQPIAPNRGLIYDRNGVLLADNIPTFNLEITPEQVEDMAATLDTIAGLIRLSGEERARFEQALASQRTLSFEPLPLRYKLTEEEVARLMVNRHRLPGVEIKSRLMRYYPLGTLTAHTVGYVGRINATEQESLDEVNYAATHHIGKTGIERSYEEVLHGRVGFQQVETNNRGRVLRTLESTPPQPGHNLYLNIDINLQRAAEAAFHGERGALVAIDPRNGAVLAMVSTPSFDPNLFVNGISNADYSALTGSADQPMFNRALRGQYPPGSTTKPFVGLAGLELGVVNETDGIRCHGYYQLKEDGHRYRDWKRSGHGWTRLDRAISESCDVYFYDLSFKLGIDRLSSYMEQFGFGRRTGIDISGERSGLMPSREWKQRSRKEQWYPGETLITGIGQGFMLATPLQLASSTATLSRYGQGMQPMVVQAIENPADGVRTPLPPTPRNRVPTVDREHWQHVIDDMEEVVHGERGTARRIGYDAPYRIAGKTGTAQVFSIAQDAEYDAEEIAKRLRDHALFIAFAPADDPRIAVALIVENGGSGSAVAAPIARAVIDEYFSRYPLDQEGAADAAR